MINSALLCFFATFAVSLAAPSAEALLGDELVAIDNNGELRAYKLPPLIDGDHARHPNRICQMHAHPRSVVRWEMMKLGEHIPDDGSFCSGRITCVSSNSRDLALEITVDMSMEGVLCRPYYNSHTHRHMCLQGKCVRVEGLFPNAPKDQDEAESDGPISNDYVEMQMDS